MNRKKKPIPEQRGEEVSWLRAHVTSPTGHARALRQQVYKYVSCFTPRVRGDGSPDGILNAAFHVVSFSRLVHPSLVRHLVPPLSLSARDSEGSALEV